MINRSAASRQLRGYQIAILVTAGLSSFALAAYWRDGNETDTLVQPVVRGRSSVDAGSTTTAPIQEASLDTVPTSGDTSLQMNARVESANGQVTHNPFGNLNLLAGLALAAGQNTGTASRTLTSKKAPKPKVESVATAVVAEAPPPPPPPPPTAPALPFSVVGGISGQQIAEGRPVAFLWQRDEVLVVRPGDEIDKLYRVETITPERIEFTYLPLQQRQTLSLVP